MMSGDDEVMTHDQVKQKESLSKSTDGGNKTD